MAYFRDFGQIVDSVRREIDEINREAYQVVEAAAGTGARMTEDLTRTRPSAKSGKRGRVETGEMADGISYDVKRLTSDYIRGDFGWLDEVEEYYVLQTETGFTHARSGEYIQPTLALQDATEHVREVLNNWTPGRGA